MLDFTRDRSGVIESARVLLEVDAALPPGDRITALRLHNAAAGQNGPAVLEAPVPSGVPLQSRFTSLVRLSGARAAALAGLAARPDLYYVNVATNGNPGGLLRGQLLPDSREYRTGAIGPEGAAAVLVTVRVVRDAAGAVRSGTISFDVAARLARGSRIERVHLHGGNRSAAIDSGIASESAARAVDVDGSNAEALAMLRALLEDPASCYVDVHAGAAALRAPLERDAQSFIAFLEEGAVQVTIRVRRDGAGNIAAGTCTLAAPGGAAAAILDAHGTQRLSSGDPSGFEAVLARPGDFFARVGSRSMPLARDAVSFRTALTAGDKTRPAWVTLRSERDPEGTVKAATISLDVEGTSPSAARLSGTGSPPIELRTAASEIGPGQAAHVADLERNPEIAQLEVDGSKGPLVAPPARLACVIEGGGWSTAIVLAAPAGRSARGIVKLLGFEGASATRAFEAPAGGTAVVFAPPQPRRASGFATVDADAPVSASSIVAADGRASTAAASGTVAGTVALPVAVDRAGGRDVEIGVAALTDAGTHLVLSLSGTDSRARQVQIALGPGESFAASIAELFTLGDTPFAGTLTIERQWASFPAGKMVVTALQIDAASVAPAVLKAER
jgi:hypothetical protein